MAKLRTYATLILLAAFCGCEQTEEVGDDLRQIGLQSVEILRTADEQLRPLPVGCEIGLFGAVNNGSSAFFARNLKYVSDGKKIVPIATVMEYPQGSSAAAVYAYTPYTSTGVLNNTINFWISSDQNTDGTASSDLMWGSTWASSDNSTNTFRMEHKMSLIRINVASKSGKSISGAKIEILNTYTSGRLSVVSGEIQLATVTPSTIRARQVAENSYEAIFMPREFASTTEFIRVSIRSMTYTFAVKPQIFEAGKAYTFNIIVRDDVSESLDGTLSAIYNSLTLGNTLSVPAKGEEKDLDLNISPISYNYFKVRNESGDHCWAQIVKLGSGASDQMSSTDAYCKLRFEENLGAERKMTLQFFDVNKPKAVYKEVVVTQPAATDYLTLSTSTLNTDKLGTLYDIPYEVAVSSNMAWAIENTNNWITPRYTAGDRNQTILIDMEANQTGAARSGVLRIMVANKEVRTIQVNQSATESSSYTLRYEVNLEITSYDNWFMHQTTNFPDNVEMFNYYPSEFGDATAKIYSNTTYGFTVDAPASFNKIVVNGLSHDKFMTCRNYSGGAVTIRAAKFTVMNSKTSYPFFRAFSVDIPIPAGVKRHQKAVFTIQITDTKHILDYPHATTSVQIVNR